jgi:hypothetical protein
MKLRTFVFWCIAVLIGVTLIRMVVDQGWNPLEGRVPTVDINR